MTRGGVRRVIPLSVRNGERERKKESGRKRRDLNASARCRSGRGGGAANGRRWWKRRGETGRSEAGRRGRRREERDGKVARQTER